MNSHPPGVPTRTPVVWVNVTDEVSNGHGIEFRHRESRGTVVAFAVGYDWLHNPGMPVTVEIVRNPPQGVSPGHWANILEQTKVAVIGFFDGSVTLGPNFDKDSVSAWYNA